MEVDTCGKQLAPENPRDGVHADGEDSAHLVEPEGGTADEDGYGEVLDDGGHEQDRWERCYQ